MKAAKLKKGRAKNAPAPVLAISGAAKIGTTELLRRAIAVIQETPRQRGGGGILDHRGGAMTEKRRTTASLASAKRLVVKIGSALLVDEESGGIRRKWLDALADDVAALRARGTDVILVSSGAIAVGRRHLGLATGRAAAGGEAGRGRDRPDPPGACLSGDAGAPSTSPSRRSC